MRNKVVFKHMGRNICVVTEIDSMYFKIELTDYTKVHLDRTICKLGELDLIKHADILGLFDADPDYCTIESNRIQLSIYKSSDDKLYVIKHDSCTNEINIIILKKID